MEEKGLRATLVKVHLWVGMAASLFLCADALPAGERSVYVFPGDGNTGHLVSQGEGRDFRLPDCPHQRTSADRIVFCHEISSGG